MKRRYQIIHNRDICIGCGACASVCPKYWSMESDGKASIIGHIKTEKGEKEVLGTNEEPLTKDFDENMNAAESCPVQCIHVIDLESKKS